MEIACDESGSEGEKLVGGNTDVFAHAGVGLSVDAAAECVREARARIGSPAQEYGANHFLREKHRQVLKWLLAEPISGCGRVHLVDKEFFLLSKVIAVLLDDGGAAVKLRGRSDRTFLEAANNLLRARNRKETADPVEVFYRVVDDLADTDEIMARLGRTRPKAESFRETILDSPVPVLDPLDPAIAANVRYWGAGEPVTIVHDRTVSLSQPRIARLAEVCGDRLRELRLVDSRDDPRIQVADFLAGVARRIAEDDLHGQGDPELIELLVPYVDPGSIWVDK